jgi:hypothetical protein
MHVESMKKIVCQCCRHNASPPAAWVGMWPQLSAAGRGQHLRCSTRWHGTPVIPGPRQCVPPYP